MPELPEVEVTRRQISRVLVGRTVSAVETTRASYFFLTKPNELKARLLGRRFAGLERVGKYLLAELDDGSQLLLHLGMTGQLFAAGATSPRLLSATAKRALPPEAQAPTLALRPPPAWTYLHGPRSTLSSTQIRQGLGTGNRVLQSAREPATFRLAASAESRSHQEP